MKFLRLIATCDPRSGGPIAGLLNSSLALERMGHETEIATLDAPDEPWISELPFKVIPLGPHIRPYGYTPRLTPWLRAHAHQYDLAVVHGIWNYISVGSWRALAQHKTPYVVFTHGSLDPWHKKFYPVKHNVKQAFWSLLEGRVLTAAERVLFTTEEEQTLAAQAFRGHGHYRSEVIAYGTTDVSGEADRQIADFRAAAGLGADEPYVLFLSRIHPKKGVDALIKAFASTAPDDMHLVIAGPDQIGWQAELEALCNTLGLQGRIHWPGMIGGDVKWGAYRGATAFALPSHGENFGIVVAEALACGRPVLITEQVNIWREVESAGAGLVAPTPDAFATTMGGFFRSSDAERNAMGLRARDLFLSRFEIGRSARDIERVAARAGGAAMVGSPQKSTCGAQSAL